MRARSSLPKRQKNTTIERAGVNYVRELFEAVNCPFKEISREHDFGHDAHVMLVDGENVTGSEIALQIKSGKSYVTDTSCKIPSTKRQRNYWLNHPFTTYGVVYDPEEGCAYHTNLKQVCFDEGRVEDDYTITFEKKEWNKVDDFHLKNVWLPLLMGRPPTIPLDLARQWAFSDDPDLSYLGSVVLRKRFGNLETVWEDFFKIFETQSAENIDPEIIYSIAHIPNHGDIFWPSLDGFLPENSHKMGKARIENYSTDEIIKLLAVVDDGGFERATIGQSCAAIILAMTDFKSKLQEVISDDSVEENIRDLANILLTHHEYLPV